MSDENTYYYPPNFFDYCSVAEVASAYGYSATHVRTLCEGGAIQARKSGKNWIIYSPSVLGYMMTKGV